MTMTSPAAVPAVNTQRSRLVINVELDDRSFLFPDGKPLSHVAIHETERGLIRLEGVFPFNETRTDPVIQTLEVEDARDLARTIIDAVYQGRTQHVLTDEVKIAILFNPNGFVLRFGEERTLKEVFVNSPAIIRIAQGLLRMVDRAGAAPPH